MFPVDHSSIPQAASGCLVVLLDRGERCGPGEIGARKPDVWLCTQWCAAGVYQRVLYSDIVGLVPTPHELAIDMGTYPDRWVRKQFTNPAV